MATFRKVHVSFWSDPFVQAMSPEQKYFYLYLLTNDKTRQCGIYEISKKQIAYDTGYNTDTVSILLRYFNDTDRIRYSEATSEIAIKNWLKYNDNPSSKVQVLVNKELAKVKDRSLIQYLYSTDTVSIHNPQGEEEEEREREEESTPPAAAPAEKNLVEKKYEQPAQSVAGHPKSGTVPLEDEKKSIPPPPSFAHPSAVYNAEECVTNNPVWFQQLLMKLNICDTEAAKEVVHKYHLHQLEKNNYPMGKVAIFAGVEKWLLNENKSFRNGTHKSNSSKKSTGSAKSAGAEHVLGSLLGDLANDAARAASA